LGDGATRRAGCPIDLHPSKQPDAGGKHAHDGERNRENVRRAGDPESRHEFNRNGCGKQTDCSALPSKKSPFVGQRCQVVVLDREGMVDAALRDSAVVLTHD